MKRLLLIPILLLATVTFGQIVDQFNFTGALNANGWASHSGAAAQFQSDNVGSLTYSGLAASAGFKASFVSGNTEDVNKAITGVSGTGYYSLLINVPNTTGLGAAGEYFIGFAKTAGLTGVSNFAGRLYIRTGSVAGTFNLGVANYSGGTVTPTYSTVDHPIGTTVFVVVSVNTAAVPYVANLFVNPTPGSTEPAPTVTNSVGTGNDFTTFASIFLRQATTTGNTQIDEIRAGSTWASVTPAGVTPPCVNTFATINPPAQCGGSYTVPSTDETYMVSGVYHDTIPNAAGCDSILTINLTIKQNTTSTLSPVSCTPYTVPSTDETYAVSGVYHDTIPNAAGCDSIITINLTITGSITYYRDFDTDGFGDPLNSQTGCAQIPGYVTNDDDCDDTNSAITTGSTYYADTDGDGLGDPSAPQVLCSVTGGFVSNNNDCDDTNPAIGAAVTYYVDTDGDGYGSASATGVSSCTVIGGSVTNNTDCNDNNPAIHPGATEIPNNGIDEDCNGSDLNTMGTTLGMYEFTLNSCTNAVLGVTTQPANATFSNYASTGTNCATGTSYFNNDGWNMTTTIDLAEYNSFKIKPASCYALDLNQVKFLHRVSGSAGTNATVHLRSSLDGFTTDLFTFTFVALNTDINETVTLPTAFDAIADSVEFRFYITGMGAIGTTYRNDNVTVIGNINALTPQTYYADADGDGYGNPLVTQSACTAPAGYVSDNTDCDDTNEDAHPGAVWYVDADGDGFGDADDTGTNSCTVVAGSVANNDDCDDSDEDVNPSAAEVCDGIDNNCDGDIDEGLTMVTYYEDADNDTYGDPASTVQDCTQPAGYVTNDDDCNDANAAIHPGAVDHTGNTIDENCDGVDGVLGIEESILAHLNVYPNPGTSSVVLNMNNGWNGFQVTFAGVDGKEIALTSLQKSANELEFNTDSLVSGVYFIRLTSASGTALVRWVKN